MHGRRIRAAAAAWALLGGGLWACATNPAPKGWLPAAAEAPRSTRGGWIVLTRSGGGKAGRVAGELIAVDEAGFVVLTTTGVAKVSLPQVERARVAGYASAWSELALWDGAGVASTLSHGGFLVFSVPMWLVGTAFMAGESKAPLIDYPAKPVAQLRKYARFPQGLPPGLDEALLGRLELKKAASPPPSEVR